MRYLTFSCQDRLPLLAEAEAKDIVVDLLAVAKDRLSFVLYAWVVMPEHMHMLLHPNVEVANVRRIMSAYKTRTAAVLLARMRERSDPFLRAITHRDGTAHFWLPGGGYDRNIHSREEFMEKAGYIEDNLVRRGLVACAEEYRWSSAGSPVLGRDQW